MQTSLCLTRSAPFEFAERITVLESEPAGSQDMKIPASIPLTGRGSKTMQKSNEDKSSCS